MVMFWYGSKSFEGEDVDVDVDVDVDEGAERVTKIDGP